MDVVFPAMLKLEGSILPNGIHFERDAGFNLVDFTRSKTCKLTLGVFLGVTLLGGFSSALSLQNLRVTTQEQQALTWIRENTREDARFLVLTFGDVLNTPFIEWFPALSGRTSVTTVQGYEWISNDAFNKRFKNYRELQPCMTANFSCVEEWIAEHGERVDYVYVYRGYVGQEKFNETDIQLAGWLLENLAKRKDYILVYSKPMIKIYQYTK